MSDSNGPRARCVASGICRDCQKSKPDGSTRCRACLDRHHAGKRIRKQPAYPEFARLRDRLADLEGQVRDVRKEMNRLYLRLDPKRLASQNPSAVLRHPEPHREEPPDDH
jgi:hypothetical protein